MRPVGIGFKREVATSSTSASQLGKTVVKIYFLKRFQEETVRPMKFPSIFVSNQNLDVFNRVENSWLSVKDQQRWAYLWYWVNPFERGSCETVWDWCSKARWKCRAKALNYTRESKFVNLLNIGIYHAKLSPGLERSGCKICQQSWKT